MIAAASMILAMTSKCASGDQRLHAKAPAHQGGEAHHHGEPGIHRADHEIGREDRFLPARHQACGEVHADDAVQRDDQRHAETGEREMQGLVGLPMPRRAAPSKRQRAINHARELCAGAIPHGGEIGNKPDIPEQDREDQD